MQLSRRKFLRGSLIVLAAPAIVRASSLMPVKALAEDCEFDFSGFYSYTPMVGCDFLKGMSQNIISTTYYYTDGRVETVEGRGLTFSLP